MDLLGRNARGVGIPNPDDEPSESLRELPKIPVFVFPASIFFNGTQQKEHQRQILTIYNPYDFPIKFKVLSTQPEFYNVINPEGSIKAKNCVDLILRLTRQVPDDSPTPLESKFRVQVNDFGTRQPLGRKDVPATIYYGPLHQQQTLPGGSLGASGRRSSENLMPTSAADDLDDALAMNEGMEYYSRKGRQQQQRQQQQYMYQNPNHHPSNINYIAIVVGIICIIGLTLPNEIDLDGGLPPNQVASHTHNRSIMSVLPSYLHLSLNQKLLIAYTLGLVTMVLFRP